MSARRPDAQQGLKHIDPLLLTPHPLNDKLYGDVERFIDEHLRDSIKEQGILVPLTITKDNVIVSGHSRWFWASRFKLKTIPVIVCNAKTEDQIEELIIHCNRQRDKTSEQKAREFKVLDRIQKDRAKKRMLAGKKSEPIDDPKEIIPEGAQARDIAAAEVGWSGKTAEKAVVVVDKIDELEAGGKVDEAQDLRATLNKKGGVSEAHRKATGATRPKLTLLKHRADHSFLNADEVEQLDQLKVLWKKCGEYVRAAFLELIDG